MFSRFCLLIIILLLFCNSVYSQPEISSVDGDVVSNGTITLSGTGFGEKSQAAPIIYDFTSFAYVNGKKNFSQSIFENGDLVKDYYGDPDSNSLWNEGGTVYYRYDLVPRVLDVDAHYLGVGANSRIGDPRMYKMDSPEVSDQLYVSWWFKPKIDTRGWHGFTLLGTNVSDFIINETIYLESDPSVEGRIFAIEESTNRIFVEAKNSMKLDSFIENPLVSSESSVEFTVRHHIYNISNVSGDFEIGDEFMLNSTGDVGEITYFDTQSNKMAATFDRWVSHGDYYTPIRNLRTNATLRINKYYDSYDTQGSSKYIRIWEDGWGKKGFRFSWTQMHISCTDGPTTWEGADVVPRKWNLMEAVIDLNQSYSVYTNGELVGSASTDDCRKFGGNYNPTIALMGFNGKQEKQGWEMGEIYMDNTLQRIVISNSSTWDPSTISYYEIQMPKTWSDTEVSFNLRQGQFDDSDELYAYVFDEIGEVNQEGFKITGETQDTSDEFSCEDIYSNDPNIFFCDGFETADLRSTNNGNFDWRDMMRTSIVTMDDEGPVAVYNRNDIYNRPSEFKNWSSLSGNYSMRFRYPAGQPMAEQRFDFGGNSYDDLWVKYSVRVPVNFKQGGTIPSNHKFLALWMDGYSGKGEGSTVIWEFWKTGEGSSRLAFHSSGVGYENTGGHIQHFDFINYTQDQGRWMDVVVRVKASTEPHSEDGVIELYRKWTDEENYVREHYKDDANIGIPEGKRGFQAGYFMGWANGAYEEETEWLIDNVVFSNSSLLYLLNSTTSSEEDTSTTPVVNFETSKKEIVYRGMFNLSWNAIGADSCNGFGDWKGEKPTSGSQEVSIIFDSTYVLNCSNEYGDTLREVSVNVSDKIVPEVSQISGSLIDGSTIRVEGNNFGEKEQAEPVLWVFGSDIRENGVKVENYSYKIGDNVTKYDNGIWEHVDKRILFDATTRYDDLVHSFYITRDGTLRNPTAFGGYDTPYSDSIYVSARIKPVGNLFRYREMGYKNLEGEFETGSTPFDPGEEVKIESDDVTYGQIVDIDKIDQKFTFVMSRPPNYYPNATVTGLQSGATLQFDKDSHYATAGASKYFRMWSDGRSGMYSTLTLANRLIVGYRDQSDRWDVIKPITEDGFQDTGYNVADLGSNTNWRLLQNFISQKGTIMYNYIDVDNSDRRYLLDVDVGEDKKFYDMSPTLSQIGIDAAGGRKEVNIALYLNEIYFDKSFQRVMLSNYSQFNQTGNELEIQYLTSWDEHDVEFELRLGALNEEDDLYLYLFNEYDVVNEQGYLLDFEESDVENDDDDSSDDDSSQDDDSNDNSGGGSSSGGSSGSGSSGGGSSSSSSSQDDTENDDESSQNDVAYEAPVCQSDFSYSAWSSCVNGSQFRIVEDQNSCVDSTQETRICRVGADENELKELNAKEVQLAKINNRRYETSFSDSYNEMVFTNEKLEDETFVVVDSTTKQQYLGTLVDQKQGKYYYTLDRIDQNNLNTLKEQGLAERSFTESASSVFEEFKNSRNFFSVLVILSLFGITTVIYVISRYMKKLHRKSTFE